ncbi:MAG: hypothetical protein JWR75_2013 [Devosia sp.]|nr:hypothetical protein [Devosia sp.]
MDGLIRGFFHYAILVCLPAITAFLVYNYVRELWVYATDRAKFNTLKKPIIMDGESGGTEISSPAGRLLFSYPFFIAGFALFCGLILARQWNP